MSVNGSVTLKMVHLSPSHCFAVITVLWIMAGTCCFHRFSLHQSPTTAAAHFSHGLTSRNLWQQLIQSGGWGAIDSHPLPVYFIHHPSDHSSTHWHSHLNTSTLTHPFILFHIHPSMHPVCHHLSIFHPLPLQILSFPNLSASQGCWTIRSSTHPPTLLSQSSTLPWLLKSLRGPAQHYHFQHHKVGLGGMRLHTLSKTPISTHAPAHQAQHDVWTFMMLAGCIYSQLTLRWSERLPPHTGSDWAADVNICFKVAQCLMAMGCAVSKTCQLFEQVTWGQDTCCINNLSAPPPPFSKNTLRKTQLKVYIRWHRATVRSNNQHLMTCERTICLYLLSDLAWMLSVSVSRPNVQTSRGSLPAPESRSVCAAPGSPHSACARHWDVRRWSGQVSRNVTTAFPERVSKIKSSWNAMDIQYIQSNTRHLDVLVCATLKQSKCLLNVSPPSIEIIP